MRLPFLLVTVLAVLLNRRCARAGEPAASAGRGSFSAQLWAVGGKEFFRDWKAGQRAPATPLVPCPELTRGGPVAAPVFAAVTFAGATADPYGLAHVRYDLRVLRPDGSVYARQPDTLGFRGWTGPGTLFPRLGRDAVAVVPERGDPPGFYLVEARVRDVVAGVELPVLRTSFLVR